MITTMRAAGAVLACLLMMSAGAVRAEVVILGSDAPGLKPGTTLADDKTLSVPQGASVRLLLPSGRTQSIKGPFSAAVKELGKGEARNDGLFKQVLQIMQSGGGAPIERPGATRGVTAPPPPVTTEGGVQFSWQQIPIDADGDYCVERGAALTLTRTNPSRALRMTVIDRSEGKRGEVSFDSGRGAMPWPAEIATKIGSYAFLVPDRPMREVRLRLISPLPDRDTLLRVLHGQRCQLQLEQAVRGIADGKL